jgi:hypothetical protein
LKIYYNFVALPEDGATVVRNQGICGLNYHGATFTRRQNDELFITFRLIDNKNVA